MCLAIPGKVVAVDAATQTATVDYEAEKREAGTHLLPDVAVGDYVLVQARMIVHRLPEEEALAALKAIKESDGTKESDGRTLEQEEERVTGGPRE